MADDTVTTEPNDVAEEFDLSNISITEEDEPIIKAPDPSKSKGEKPPRTERVKAKKTAPPYSAGKFVRPLTEMYAFIGMGLAPFDAQCATAIMENGENCAKAWDAAAKENLALRRMLQTLVEGSTWSMVVAAHLPIVMSIVSHHAPNRIPDAFRPEAPEDEQEVSRGQHAA